MAPSYTYSGIPIVEREITWLTYGKSMTRHIASKDWGTLSGGPRRATLCKMFYRSQEDKLLILAMGGADEQGLEDMLVEKGYPICRACSRTAEGRRLLSEVSE